MDLCWCTISIKDNCYKNVKNLTNDFCATITLIRDIPHIKDSLIKNQSIEEKIIKNKKRFSFSSNENFNHSAGGICAIDSIHQRQKLMFEFSDKIEAKFSLNDFYALRNLISHSLQRLNNSNYNAKILKETTQHYDNKRLIYLILIK